MPCKVCGTSLIYIYDYPTCPKCEHVTLVPYEDSIKIAKHLLDNFKKAFFEIVKPFKKTHILANVFWQREKQIRKFYQKYSTIELSRLLSCTLLLRRVFQMNGFLEQNDVNEVDANKMIIAYEALADFEEACIKLKSNHFSMVKMFPYDINNLDELKIKDNTIIFPNETYDRIMITFSQHNIMTTEEADKKMEVWSKNFVKPKFGAKKSQTPEETISRFYDLISSFYMALYRSQLYLEAFGLPNENLGIDPLQIKRFCTRHPTHPTGISLTKYDDFKKQVRSYFSNKSDLFEENFVLSETNLPAFPFFIKFDDNVLNSQAFGEFFSYTLHAILNKELFDNETEKRSKEFESKTVKEKFEELGFKYVPPYQVKGNQPMEIDGIAISNSRVFVIEVKGWGAKRLIEEKTAEDILIRETKNAIFGYHFVVKTNQLKKKVSIGTKVKWVDENRSKFGISPTASIKGLLVINQHPPFPECGDCLVRSVNNLDF